MSYGKEEVLPPLNGKTVIPTPFFAPGEKEAFLEKIRRIRESNPRTPSAPIAPTPNEDSAGMFLREYGFLLPRKFAHMTLDSMLLFLPKPMTPLIVDALTQFRDRRKGILLCGGTGTGKTALACAILNWWNAEHPVFPGAFVHYPFYQMQRATLHRTELDAVQMRVVQAREPIVFDEVGLADNTYGGNLATTNGDRLAHLSTIISMRNVEECRTIVTTNLASDALEGQLGKLVTSRLREYTCIEFRGKDSRGDA